MTSTVPHLRWDGVGPPRLLAGWVETDAPADYTDHRARYGPLPWEVSGPVARTGLIETVAHAGLRGRGGGAFPIARKLAALPTGEVRVSSSPMAARVTRPAARTVS